MPYIQYWEKNPPKKETPDLKKNLMMTTDVVYDMIT